MRGLWAAIALLLASQAGAGPTSDDPWPLAHTNDLCDDRAMAANLAEPWNRYSETGPMNASRLSILDLGDDAPVRFAFMWIVRDVMTGDLEACRIITITEPNMALSELPIQSISRRRGMLGFDVNLATRFAVTGETRTADSRIRVSLDREGWKTRVQLLSIGSPWNETHWQGPVDDQ